MLRLHRHQQRNEVPLHHVYSWLHECFHNHSNLVFLLGESIGHLLPHPGRSHSSNHLLRLQNLQKRHAQEQDEDSTRIQVVLYYLITCGHYYGSY